METEKMKFQNGKIYVIRSPSTDKIYIGSTIEKYLSNRFGGHKSNYKNFLNGKYHNVTSFEIIKLGDSYIELLELFPCNSKLELCKREGEMIREHKLNCVNKNIAGRAKKEYQKEYKIDKKEKITKYQKEYNKQNYENHKAEILEKHKQTYICDCGSELKLCANSRHNKTIKHKTYLNSIN